MASYVATFVKIVVVKIVVNLGFAVAFVLVIFAVAENLLVGRADQNAVCEKGFVGAVSGPFAANVAPPVRLISSGLGGFVAAVVMIAPYVATFVKIVVVVAESVKIEGVVGLVGIGGVDSDPDFDFDFDQ